MKSYAVFTFDWSYISAGLFVLHTLAHKLQGMGLPVYLNVESQNPDWEHIPILDEYVGDRKDLIGIYPEIFGGNPFNAGTVVRYLLHLPGYFGGPEIFDKKDLLFTHSRFFNQRIGLPEDRIIFFPYLNTSNFYDMGLERKYKYYYARKGNSNLDSRIADLPPITVNLNDYEGKEGQKLLAEKLNQTEVLYCYDNVTAMIDIARLCGCPVVLIPDGFWTEEECKKFSGWEVGGICYDIENEDYARSTISSQDIKNYYEVTLEEEGKRSLKRFMRITQNGCR